MSNDPKDELVEALRNLRDHAQFLKELGVEHIALDSSTALAPLPAVTAQATATAPAKIPADTRRAFESPTLQPVPPKPTGREREPLFSPATPSAPALSPSTETLDEIW